VNSVRKLEETGGIDVLQVKGNRHRSRTEQNLKPLLFLQQNKKKGSVTQVTGIKSARAAAPFDTTKSTDMMRKRISEFKTNMRRTRPAGKIPRAIISML
jgi:hypothetical protein